MESTLETDMLMCSALLSDSDFDPNEHYEWKNDDSSLIFKDLTDFVNFAIMVHLLGV